MALTETPSTEGQDKTVEVYSWGIIANGRLGHGMPKPKIETTLFGQPKVKNTPRFQSLPQSISTLVKHSVVDISAGNSHSLAVSNEGYVFAWGSNDYGACGVTGIDPDRLRGTETKRYTSLSLSDLRNGVTLPSLWDDVWVPRRVPIYHDEKDVTISSVAAGGIHSAALDVDGLVYTWGGGGQDDCLGHGDISSYEFQNKDTNTLRNHVLAMSGSLQPPQWSVPRVLESMKEVQIKQISLGDRHGAALSKLGSLYVWGLKSVPMREVRYFPFSSLESMSYFQYIP